MENLVAPLINLVILLAVMVIYLRAPLRAFVADRHANLRDQVQSVRQQLAAAQEKYEEFSAKLKTIDSEVAILRDQARADAQAAKQRTVAEAKRLSEQVVVDAKQASAQLYTDFKTQLYQDLAVRALNRAEAILTGRLTGDDKARLRQEFSSQLEGAQS